MKLKLNLKTIVMGISGAIVLLIAILMIILSVASRKPVAAFYGISERNQAEITDVLQKTHSRKNKNSLPFEIITLDNNISLERALKKSKKVDLLFVYNGLNLEYAANHSAKKKLSFSQDILKGMTSSVREATQVVNGMIPAVPLLIDNYEVDVSLDKFHSSRVKNINVLSDLEKLAKITKSSTPAPIIFPAGEDAELINLFGALTEAISGKQTWESAKNKIAKQVASGKVSQNNFYDTLVKLSAEGGEYHDTVSTLREWYKLGIIPKNVYSMNSRDIKAFMSSDLTTATFITLSQHREMERNIVIKYSSVYYPAVHSNVERNFTAPIIFAVPMSKDPVAKKAITQMANELQATLSAKTGLGPTQANCSVPDIQADDVRYWVAASNTPLPALSDALFVNKQQKNAFAEALRSILRQ